MPQTRSLSSFVGSTFELKRQKKPKNKRKKKNKNKLETVYRKEQVAFVFLHQLHTQYILSRSTQLPEIFILYNLIIFHCIYYCNFVLIYLFMNIEIDSIL